MKTIWKFELNNDVTDVEAPVVKFLTVQKQANKTCVWAIVDTTKCEEKAKYRIMIAGTGWNLNGLSDDRYIGTVQEGYYVWHYFWEKLDSDPAVQPSEEEPNALSGTPVLKNSKSSVRNGKKNCPS